MDETIPFRITLDLYIEIGGAHSDSAHALAEEAAMLIYGSIYSEHSWSAFIFSPGPRVEHVRADELMPKSSSAVLTREALDELRNEGR